MRRAGGFIGTRKVPSLLSASGVWRITEAEEANRDGLWPSGSDPYWSNVSLLLAMDGSNGSTTFTDSSNNAFAVTVTGDAQVSTAQSKFGESGLFDGTGDRLEVSSNAAFAFGTGDFTVELFFRLTSIKTAAQGFVNVNTSGGFSFYYNGSDGFFGGANSFRVSNRSSNLITQSQALSTGVWYHAAVSRAGGTMRLFLDGAQIASVSNTTNFAQGVLQIGGTSDGSTWTIDGHLDDLRITKGVGRYTQAFTAPVAAHPIG